MDWCAATVCFETKHEWDKKKEIKWKPEVEISSPDKTSLTFMVEFKLVLGLDSLKGNHEGRDTESIGKWFMDLSGTGVT